MLCMRNHAPVGALLAPVDSRRECWECKEAVRAVIQLVMVMGGELWLDDVVLEVGK